MYILTWIFHVTFEEILHVDRNVAGGTSLNLEADISPAIYRAAASQWLDNREDDWLESPPLSLCAMRDSSYSQHVSLHFANSANKSSLNKSTAIHHWYNCLDYSSSKKANAILQNIEYNDNSDIHWYTQVCWTSVLN